MNLTERQQEAVDYRGSNLLVSASAGSGKTEVLARRCAALIADPETPLDVNRLLVVTFTRAAAAELRVRVAKMLRQSAVVAQQTRNRALHEHLRRQQILLDTAEIGTIDGWCARIVRENFAAVPGGIDPSFGILGEEDAALLRRGTLDDLFHWIYTSDAQQAEQAREWLLRGSKPGDFFLRAMIEELNRYREHLVNADTWLARQVAHCGRDTDALRQNVHGMIAGAIRAECAFQQEQIKPLLGDGRYAELRDKLTLYNQQLAEWTRLLEENQLEQVAAAISAFRYPTKPKGASDIASALHKEINDQWFKKRLKEVWSGDVVKDCVESAPRLAELTAVLLQLEARYQAFLSMAKRARGVCEFGDVLRMALDVLGAPDEGQCRKPTPIAMALRRRYEHVLVDEYQDTSPVQVELLRLVTRESPVSNRFMVGDVKQSIYGFREAEPRLLVDLIETYRENPAAGRVLFLPDNFRSHARLVNGLNEIFGALFERTFGGTDYAPEERLCARRDEIANPALDAKPRIELHVLLDDVMDSADAANADGEDESKNGDEVPLIRIEREACVTARAILELFEKHVQTPERTADVAVRLRPVRWADVVVLLRSAKENAPRLASVLRAHGIPCVAAGRESLLDNVEVSDVRTALALLVNRRQDIPLAAHLRGPFVGLDAEQLLKIRQASERDSFHDTVEEYLWDGDDTELRTALDAAWRRLDAWQIAARTEDVTILLRRILRETGHDFFARALPGGEQRGGLLAALEALAREAADGGARTVADFVEFLDALDERQLAPTASTALGEDVVRVMTIHAAKGLEFPFVFVVGAGARFSQRPRRGSLECDESTGIGLDFLDYPDRKQLRSAALQINRQGGKQRDLEEELRLFYVAATRAREKLIFVGHSTESKWNELHERFTGAGQRVPLIARLNAASVLEWAGQAVATRCLSKQLDTGPNFVQIETHDAATIDPFTTEKEQGEDAAEKALASVLTTEDREWARRSAEALRAELDTRSARFPAVLSVSAVKQAAAHVDETEADAPRSLEYRYEPAVPAFAAGQAVDGRDVGDAYHRFMQLADLTRLNSADTVREQIAECVTRMQLSEAAAALIRPVDIMWFVGTALGRRMAASPERVRREVPFVYACPIGAGEERVILRGVIDCLIEADEGLVLLDYKTDRPRDEADWRRRLSGYEAQLRCYAEAARAVFGRDVREAHLAFIREQRCVAVDLIETDLPRLLVQMEAG